MTTPTRTTNVMKYRRFVVETVVTALRNVFNNSYSRERQFANLKITTQYGFQKTDYPQIVVDFTDRVVRQAGVGHTEWFDDATGVLRKWEHARFEGVLTLKIYALSTYDRDLLADAIVEIMQFGRLDLQLDQFFVGIYGADNAPVAMIFNQLMLNTDEMQSQGNSASIAPWSPEDQLVYMTGYSMDLHGGFYNYNPTDTWSLASLVNLFPYPQGEVTITIPIIPAAGTSPLTNPFVWVDSATIRLVGTAYEDDTMAVNLVQAVFSPSGIDSGPTVDIATVTTIGAPSGSTA